MAVGREAFVYAIKLEKGAVERIARGCQIFTSLGCFLILYYPGSQIRSLIYSAPAQMEQRKGHVGRK